MNIGKSLHVQPRKSTTIDNSLDLAILKKAMAKKSKKNKVTKGNKALVIFTIAWLIIISL